MAAHTSIPTAHRPVERPARTRRARPSVLVVTALVVALLGMAVTAPAARAEPWGGVYSRSDVARAAEFIAQHGAAVNTASGVAGAASGFCGPAARACAALVTFVYGAYTVYSGTVTNANRHGRCVLLYGGESLSGDVPGPPVIDEYSGIGCHPSGEPTNLDEQIMDSWRSQMAGR